MPFRSSGLSRLAFLASIALATPCAIAQESLLLSPGDLLHVTVYDVPELEQHVRVTDQGTVVLALIGTMHVGGMPPAEAALRIADALSNKDLVRKPQVNLLVEQFAAADISVMGQVAHPGSYAVKTPRNLMDVLSMAGGLTPLADIHITVKRRGGESEVLTASLPNSAETDLRNALTVYPGDLVIVPKAGIVYVLGDVTRPGAYVMSNDAGLSVLQAIALASGTTKTSSESHARLVRQTPEGPVDLPLALSSMEKGTQPDLQLQAEDVVYIPFSTAKNIMLGASSILSSTGGAAVYAVR